MLRASTSLDLYTTPRRIENWPGVRFLELARAAAPWNRVDDVALERECPTVQSHYAGGSWVPAIAPKNAPLAAASKR